MKKWLCAVSLVLLTATRVLPSSACAVMMEPEVRPEDAVVVTDESAVIVWDAAKKRQHFIRGATFKGASRDIAFLVPSPSTPELQEASRDAFAVLKKALEPKIEHRTEYEFRWFAFFDFGAQELSDDAVPAGAAKSADEYETTRTAKPAVEVLQTQSVAGYDATTLKATNPTALNRWLNKNGYLAQADFKEWLTPYIENGWVITAFKIRKAEKNQKQFSSSLVRMSFDTAKPFFPYREPANQRVGVAQKTPRSLRVFFIGEERMAGALGTMEKRAWPGSTKWSDDLANHLDEAERGRLAKYLALAPEQFPAALRMTSFEDHSSPRPGFDEVYFSPAMQQEKILPPPIIKEQKRTILIPLDVLFVFGVLGIWMFSVRRSKRAASG